MASGTCLTHCTHRQYTCGDGGDRKPRKKSRFNEPLHRRTLLASGGGRIYMTCPHGPSPAAPGRSLVIVLFRCRTSSQPYDFLKVHEQTRPCIYLYGGAYLYASMGLCINKQMATRGGRHEVKAPVARQSISHTEEEHTHLRTQGVRRRALSCTRTPRLQQTPGQTTLPCSPARVPPTTQNALPPTSVRRAAARRTGWLLTQRWGRGRGRRARVVATPAKR